MLKQIAAALLIGVGLTGCMVEPKTDKDCKSVTKPKVDQAQVDQAQVEKLQFIVYQSLDGSTKSQPLYIEKPENGRTTMTRLMCNNGVVFENKYRYGKLISSTIAGTKCVVLWDKSIANE